MPLESLELSNFGAFEKLKLEFCPGINVLIGPNSTGKTHAMKAAYAVLRVFSAEATRDSANRHEVDPKRVAGILREKFVALYRPDDGDVSRLVHRGGEKKPAIVRVRAGGFDIEVDFTRKNGAVKDRGGPFRDSTIFLPSRELLAIFEGFTAVYESREIAFDETYYDACKALALPSLRGAKLLATKPLAEPLLDVLGGSRPRIRGGKFYLRQDGADMEAHLLSEGLRKLAAVVQLVENGALGRRSVLFWDEPEANLNPALLSKLVDFLIALAKHGVQIVLATHDYMLAHRISRVVEHRLNDVEIRFFSFFRDRIDAAVEVESGASLLEIEHNPLLDELARFQEEEVEFALADRRGAVKGVGGARKVKANAR